MNWEKLLTSERIGERGKKSDISRSIFDQDYDRIIFSHPFRRLQDKTQVFPLPEHDFVHTRLTHSLEVSSVGRTLGRTVGKTIIERSPALDKIGISEFDFGAIVAAASLTHDLGNPPFGHSGEDAISDFFRTYGNELSLNELLSDKEKEDITHYEGNAQGFRILNKSQGLNLSIATLSAFTKYPRESLLKNKDENRASQKKYGFFQAEKDIFKEIADKSGLKKLSVQEDYTWCRHPLAFLVEAADDICYHIIDLEDGCRLGLVSYEETLELLGAILKDQLDLKKLNMLPGLNEKIGLLRAMAIGKLIKDTSSCFLDHEKDILSGNFDKSLTGLIKYSDCLNQIMKVSIKKIYRSEAVVSTEAAGFEVIPGLLKIFVEAAMHKYYLDESHSKKHDTILRLFPPDILSDIKQNKGYPYKIILACVDLVTSMTDSFAISTYRRLKGISLPKI